MGPKKNRNGMDLKEAEDIKKRWQEYTKELYKKDLHDPDNSSRKLEIPREHFMQEWAQKRTEMVWT